MVRREEWDCTQLGLEVGKLEEIHLDDDPKSSVDLIGEALRVAKDLGLVHLAARVQTSERHVVRALQAGGFRLVDTVVTLRLPLADLRDDLRPPAGVTIREAEAADGGRLGELAAEAFSDPLSSFNRYLNDGGFSRAQVRKVYETWARTSVGGPAADGTLVACIDDRIVGFLTMKWAGADGTGRVPLNAVDARVRGRGIYRALVLRAARVMAGRGARRLDVTTQLQQLAVQRTWWGLGAQATGSAYSFHLWLDGRLSAR